MFLVDYILIKKKNHKSSKICELSVNLAENHVIQVGEITQGWFIGRSDGASFSKIILCDRSGHEFMLVVKLESSAEEGEVQALLTEQGFVHVGSLKSEKNHPDLVRIPVKVFNSEIESIRSLV